MSKIAVRREMVVAAWNRQDIPKICPCHWRSPGGYREVAPLGLFFFRISEFT
jgi:hypothetical protein